MSEYARMKSLARRSFSLVAVLVVGMSAGCDNDGGKSTGSAGGSDGYGENDRTSAGAPSGTLPGGSITFSADSVLTTDALWGDDEAKLAINKVGNLGPFPGLTIAAAVDGIPCTTAKTSDTDSTVLELVCAIRPGNAQKAKPKLVIKAYAYTASYSIYYVDIPRGTFDVPVKECDAAPVPALGVPLPQLCRVDPGSTADVGNAYEGIYSGKNIQFKSSDAGSSEAGLVASDGTYISIGGEAGRLVPTEGLWTMSDGFAFATSDAIKANYGTFGFGETEGTYIPYKSNSLMFDTYGPANALAVTASSVAGTWTDRDGENALAIVVDGDTGTISGTTEYDTANNNLCVVSGTIRLHDAGSAKNLYDVTLTAASAPGTTTFYQCHIPSDAVLKGLAAINFVNVGTTLNPVYNYALDLAAYEADKAMLSGRFYKQ